MGTGAVGRSIVAATWLVVKLLLVAALMAVYVVT
jgi:hypothetical protein